MKNKIIVIVIALSFFQSSFSQKQGQARLDSLMKELKSHKTEDTIRVKLLNDVAYEYYSKKPDKGIEYAEEAKNLSKDLNYKYGLATSYRVLGISYWAKSDYPLALQHYLKSLKLCGEIGDKVGIAGNYGNIGLVYNYQSDFEKALLNFRKALSIYEELNDKQGIANNLSHIGNVYQLKKNYSAALEYNIKALQMNEELGNKKGIALNLGNIGSAYQIQNNYVKAMEYQLKALQINRELNRNRGAMLNLGNIGEMYLAMAMHTNNKSLNNNYIYKNPNKEKYLRKSIEYTQEALMAAKDLGANIELSGWYNNLSEAYQEEGNWEKAFFYADSSRTLLGSIFSNKAQGKIAALEIQQERELKEHEIKQKKIILYYSVALLFLISLLTFFIYTRYRIKRKSNLILEKKNMQISRQNQEITFQKDTINHAFNTIKMLSEIGQEITKNLTSEKIIETVYENIKVLMNSNVFGIGIYNSKTNSLEFSGAKESEETLPSFSFDLTDENRLATICFNNQKEIIISSYLKEATKYIRAIAKPIAGKNTESLLYIPLNTKEKRIGVITVQSFEKYAYSEYHIDILRNLSLYVAIALDNAEAYRQIEKQRLDISVKNEILENQSSEIIQKNEQLTKLNESKDKYLKTLNADLNLASDYVKSLIPVPLANDSIKISWLYKPSLGVGGDSLGYHWLDDNNLAVYLIDVSGHGVGAALHSVSVLNSIKNESLTDVDFKQPERVLEKLNEVYKMENYYEKYFTMWYGVYNCSSKNLIYAGAGHPYPFLVNGIESKTLESKNPLIGYLNKFDFKSHQIQLLRKSNLYIFSDGVYEIKRQDGKFMNIEDMYAFLLKQNSDSNNELEKLYEHSLIISGHKRLKDDFTILKMLIK